LSDNEDITNLIAVGYSVICLIVQKQSENRTIKLNYKRIND